MLPSFESLAIITLIYVALGLSCGSSLRSDLFLVKPWFELEILLENNAFARLSPDQRGALGEEYMDSGTFQRHHLQPWLVCIITQPILAPPSIYIKSDEVASYRIDDVQLPFGEY